MKDIIEQAKALAFKAHAGQVRKYTGVPYTEHLEEVATLTAKYLDSHVAIAAAWLHDVPEDTDIKLDSPEFQSPSPLHMCVPYIDALTNDHEKDWSRFEKWAHNYRRLIQCNIPVAQTIKICDCMSNLKDIMQHDREYGVRYLAEKFVLVQGLNLANRYARHDVHMMISDTVNNVLTKEERKEFIYYIGACNVFAVSDELDSFVDLRAGFADDTSAV